MRKLIDTPNIGAANSTYPDGVIVDNAGAIVGTALTEILYGDMIQGIHKLKRLAGITENNLPDNETNGFQILSALLAQVLPIWQPVTSKVDLSKAKFVMNANGIYYHKTLTNTTTPPISDSVNWAPIFYWNGTKIVFSDDARITTIESNVAPLINNISETLLTLLSGFSYTTNQPLYKKRGYNVTVHGDFMRTSGSGISILNIPATIYPSRNMYFVATPRDKTQSAPISIRISSTTGLLSPNIGTDIVNNVVYDFTANYLL